MRFSGAILIIIIVCKCKTSELLQEDKEYTNTKEHYSEIDNNDNCNSNLTNLKITQKATEIEVTWGLVPEIDKCSYNYEYRVNLTQDLNIKRSERINTSVYHINDIEPCTRYNVSVEMFEKDNPHVLGTLVETYDSTITLHQVQILNSTVTNSSIRLRWAQNPNSTWCKIQYKITKENTSLHTDIPYIRYQNHTQHLFKNLESCTLHNISIIPSSPFLHHSNDNDLHLLLNISTLPDKVSNLSLEIQHGDTEISWSPPINQDCIKEYKISWNNVSQTTHDKYLTTNETLYCTEVTVEAIDRNNNPGKAVYALKPGPVLDLQIKPTDTLLEVSWQEPKDPDCVIGYIVELIQINEAHSTPLMYHEFSNLEPCTDYTVKVAARSNEETNGDFTSISAKTLQPKEIERVENLEVDENNTSVTWKPPPNIGACGIEYFLQIYDNNIEISNDTTTDTSYDIDAESLIGCKDYNISVTATIGSLQSEPSSENFSIQKVTYPPTCIKKEVNKTWAILECTTDNYETNKCNIEEIFVNCEAPKSENEGTWIIWNANNSRIIKDDPNLPFVEITIDKISENTNYTCAATIINSAGESSASGPIKLKTLEGEPGPPTEIETASITNTSFIIKWKEPEKLPGVLQKYHVTIKSNGPEYFMPKGCIQKLKNEYEEEIDPPTNEYHFSEALPKHSYEIYIKAETEAGYGESGDVKLRSTEAGVPNQPENMNYQIIKNDLKNYSVEVNISWTFPCYTNGIIKYFKVGIEGIPVIDLDAENHINSVDQPINDPIENLNYEYTFKNLQPAFKYVVQLTSVTEDNFESIPAEVEFISPESLPKAPTLKPISEVTPDTFKVEWDEPKRKNGKLLAYTVFVTNLGSLYWVPETCTTHDQNYANKVPPDKTNFKFKDGVPNYKYKVQIVANTSIGFGEMSNEVITETSELREPEPVRSLHTEVKKQKTEEYNAVVEVSFQHPCRTYGTVTEFIVILNGQRQDYDPHEQEYKIKNNPQQNDYQHSFNLHPEYNYTLTVQAQTDGFHTDTSETFTSPAGVPPALNKSIAVPTPHETNQAAFSFSSDLFNSDNGKILYYSLIIGVLHHEEKSKFGFWEDGNEDTWPEVGGNSSDSSQPYEATPRLWNPFKNGSPIICTVILGDNSLSESNKPLEPEVTYKFKIRGFTRHGYRDSETVTFILPEEINIALILGLIFGILGTAIILGFVFILWRKRQRWAMKKESIKSIPLTPMPVSIKQFSDYYNELKQNHEKLKQEYALLNSKSNEVILPSYEGLLPENKKKNRYTNIMPYDQTRVKLMDTNDNYTITDYINASYIQGYSGTTEYIATQGPLEQTCLDFWKMVIQENVSLIVMVAQFVEQNKDKCFKYFPNNHENMELENGIAIRCCTELSFNSYTVRTFLVQKDLQQWTVTHLQFTDWPDFGCPTGTEVMLEFCQLMREHAERNFDPTIIHCSAGVGRTGTLIALDIILQAINNKQDIDIFGTVLNLRRDRKNMVQTEKQYLYIHSCIKDSIECPAPISNGDVMKDPIYENLEDIKQESNDVTEESQF